jgi:hypothetical protein
VKPGVEAILEGEAPLNGRFNYCKLHIEVVILRSTYRDFRRNTFHKILHMEFLPMSPQQMPSAFHIQHPLHEHKGGEDDNPGPAVFAKECCCLEGPCWAPNSDSVPEAPD